MKTVKEQINADFTGMERESNQKCEIIDRKFAPNGCGAEFIKINFVSETGHPYDAKGFNIVVVEDGNQYDVYDDNEDPDDVGIDEEEWEELKSKSAVLYP
jgi:hypothetical protein